MICVDHERRYRGLTIQTIVYNGLCHEVGKIFGDTKFRLDSLVVNKKVEEHTFFCLFYKLKNTTSCMVYTQSDEAF